MGGGSIKAPHPVEELMAGWKKRMESRRPAREEMEIMMRREEEEERGRAIEARRREARRLEDLRIPPRHQGLSLENYSAACARQEEIAAFLREYAKRPLEEMENLIVRGAPGTGKTRMICAFIQGFPAGRAQYWKLSDILRTVKDGYDSRKGGRETELQFIKKLAAVPILAIDEIGRQAGSQFERGFIFDLLDDRYNNLTPTIIASNLPVDAGRGRPSLTSYLGISAMDRINENSLDIHCDWGNLRDRGARPEAAETGGDAPRADRGAFGAVHTRPYAVGRAGGPFTLKCGRVRASRRPFFRERAVKFQA
jgi:DNA replication protein DnaC